MKASRAALRKQAMPAIARSTFGQGGLRHFHQCSRFLVRQYHIAGNEGLSGKAVVRTMRRLGKAAALLRG